MGIRTHDQLRAVWKARDRDVQPVRGYVSFGSDPEKRTVQERWFFVTGHELFYTVSRESSEHSGVYLADVFCPVITQVTEVTLKEFCAVGDKVCPVTLYVSLPSISAAFRRMHFISEGF